jgi:flagellar basal body rod protein FlgC
MSAKRYRYREVVHAVEVRRILHGVPITYMEVIRENGRIEMHTPEHFALKFEPLDPATTTLRIHVEGPNVDAVLEELERRARSRPGVTGVRF